MRTFSRWVASLIGVAFTAVLSPQVCAADLSTFVRNETDFHHTAWNSVGAVFDIKQSPEGYLWLTTSKGVTRFDGVQFQTVEQVTRGAARDGDIDSVFLSPSGGLWLTTEGAGLLLWKDGRIKVYPDRRCTPTRKQGQVIEDLDGSLWVQARVGLFRLRGDVCEQVGADQNYPGGFSAGIFLDSDGTLWVKTQKGPLLYLRRGHSRFEANAFGGGPVPGYAYIRQAPDKTIWLSDDQGLRRVTSRPGAAAFAPPHGVYLHRDQFHDFAFATDDSLWAVDDRGVRRFDGVGKWTAPVASESAPGELFALKQGLSSDAVWKVLLDKESTWVATNSGLDQWRRALIHPVRLPPSQEREYSIAVGDRGSVWTGNSALPLTHVAPDGRTTTVAKTGQTLTLHRDHNGTIWSAGMGDNRFWRSSGSDFAPVHYPEEGLEPVVFIATDRHSDLWITTNSGRAFRQSKNAWSDETDVLGKKPGVTGAMVDDDAGNVWFAFSNKVVEWDGAEYHRFEFPDGQRGVSENTMSVRGDHVWLGGAGGVQLFTGGHFYLMRWKDQVLPGRVSGVVETRSGDLWVNGFLGITHVSAAELKRWLSDKTSQVAGEHLDEVDGLPGLSSEPRPEPSVVEAPDERLWFATAKGIAWLDPGQLEKERNPVPPQVVISAVVSNGKTFGGTNGLALPAKTENIEIDYTALSLTIPERMLFRYKLEGVDSDWQSVGTRRQAYYTKLRPDHYRFRVIASNNDGVWNEAGAVLDFTITPAWFQMAWFYLLCAAGVALLVSELYRRRMQALAGAMKARFDERLAERTRIAQELHDTLLQGFLSVSMQVHVAADTLPSGSQAKPILTRALQLMHQVIEEGRHAVRGLRPSHSASLDLEQAFASVQQDLVPEGGEHSETEFRVTAEGERKALRPLLRDEIHRIGREALTNAFRHAHANKINVELKYGARQFLLLVRDDGRGIESDVLTKGRDGHWGISGMRERAERIGGRLRIFSSSYSGTEVELSVPASLAYEDRHERRRKPDLAAKAGS